MLDINITDSGLRDFKNTKISIQLCLDGFSFGIFSANSNALQAFRHYKFKNLLMQDDLINATGDILRKDNLLKHPHSEIRIVFINRKATLLPNQLLASENLKPILEFNQPVDDLDEIHINKIKSCNSSMVFTIPTYIAGLFTEIFKNALFYNQATPLLHQYTTSNNKQNLLIIQLNPGFFDLLVIRDGKLALYNTFEYSSSNDIVYYVLFACKQLDIDSRATELHAYGASHNQKDIMNDISDFLGTEKKNTPIIHSDNILVNKVDSNRFYTLLKLIDCE